MGFSSKKTENVFDARRLDHGCPQGFSESGQSIFIAAIGDQICPEHYLI
jgi:hypothetical protein